MAQPARFAELLDRALHRIRAEKGRPINTMEDELGHLLDKAGSSYIQHLRKGNLPASTNDVETLARALTHQGGLTREECLRFLQYADHPHAQAALALIVDERIMNRPEPLPPEGQHPFSMSKPAAPAQFVGRAREVKQILGWWAKPPMQDGIIIGPRRSGKTSLVRYLEHCLKTGPAAHPRHRVVSIDFSLSRMCALQTLLRHMLHGLQLDAPEPCDLESFMEIVTSADCWQAPTVFLMDEVDLGLKSPELTTAFWNNLRYLVNNVTDGNLAFLLACTTNPAEIAKQEGKTSHFFNILTTVRLGPLTETEARALIARSDARVSDGDAGWIWVHSQGWPINVQTLCHARLRTREMDEPGDDWRDAALAQLAPNRHLLEG